MTPPYAHLPEAAVNALPKLTGKAARVLIAVASFMDGRGECWPGVPAIGERAGIARDKTVSAAIGELRHAGVLAVRRRRRQSNRFVWANLDKAESAPPTILDRAKSAPLDRAESALQKDTTEVTSSRDASHTGAKKSRQASTKKPGPPVWAWWVDANRDAGQPDPVKIGPDLGAARELGKAVTRGELAEGDLRGVLALYLADDDDWIVRQGHALRHLPGRIGAYRNHVKELDPPADPETVKRMEQIDADAARTERVKE